MAPLFSKIAIPPFPNIPVISGLICGHAGCLALFSDLEDLKAHAVAAHVGDVAAITCGIYERHLKSGEVELYRVLDENDENDDRCEEKTTISERNEGLTNLNLNSGDPALDCGSQTGQRLETDFVHATSLRSSGFLRQSEPASTPTDISKGTPSYSEPSHPTDQSLSSTSSLSSNFFALDGSNAGKVVAVSRTVSEHQLETGEVELRVIDKDNERENESSERTRPTPIPNPLDTNGEAACGTEQLEAGFVRASTLLPSINSPCQCEPLLVPPTQVHQAIVSGAIRSSIDQASMPAGQSPSHPAQPLSRHSTSSSISSFSSEDGGDDTNLKLNRIFSMVQEVFHERCRICWVERTRSQSHNTFRCPQALCSGTEWKLFKTDLRFPPGKVCYFCMAPYCPPFNHAPPPPGVRRTADLCDYPDVLKELSYILYANQSLRQKVFGRLGHAMPQTLEEYKRHISSRQNGGTFGAYNVIYAYLEVREAEKTLAQ